MHSVKLSKDEYLEYIKICLSNSKNKQIKTPT